MFMFPISYSIFNFLFFASLGKSNSQESKATSFERGFGLNGRIPIEHFFILRLRRNFKINRFQQVAGGI
jgi:hypothetical protein